MCKTYIEGVLV